VANPYYLDLGTRIDSLLEKNGAAIGIVETDRPWEYGVVELDDGQVTNIVEKPAQGEEPSSLKTMVLHQLNADFLEILKAEANEEYAYESALKQYISTQSVQASHQQPYQTLKYCWHLFDFFNEIMENRETHIDDAASVAETAIIDDSRGPVIVEAGARVGDFAKIAGPCYIGSDALVGDYSFVRGSQIAAGSTVGAYTEVVRSLIFEKTSIHQSYLADSILDREVKVGAGLTTANKRLDRTEIRSMVKEKLRQTDRRAFGLAVGRGAQIGIDVSSMPGMLIAPDAEVLPKTNIERNIL
jgi:bifunctional UDP-N-acetylglucosamine pyrophosphorylase/glucosamine-1-phosphate N-acetyltransferase